MHIATLLHSLPVALDGESVTAGNTALALISAISMLFGYILLAALWYFVFSAKARERRGRHGRD